jgi:hypothetical protein
MDAHPSFPELTGSNLPPSISRATRIDPAISRLDLTRLCTSLVQFPLYVLLASGGRSVSMASHTNKQSGCHCVPCVCISTGRCMTGRHDQA